MTPENTPATGARDTFKHPNYCCNTEIENITLSVVCVMMLSLQKTAHQVVKHRKPITEEDERREQLKEAQERRDKKKDQRRK